MTTYLVSIALDPKRPPSPGNTLHLKFTSWFRMMWALAFWHSEAALAGRVQFVTVRSFGQLRKRSADVDPLIRAELLRLNALWKVFSEP